MMDEMHSGGLLSHPVQLEDDSILMLGHRDKVMILEGRADLRRATGLQVEALTHGDLFMNGPGRDGGWALAELALFWVSIAGMIAAFAPVSATAAWLLVPYLVWVSFAGFLNWTLWRLNPAENGAPETRSAAE